MTTDERQAANSSGNTIDYHRRDSLIDLLRGGAILLVIAGHIIQYSNVNFDDNLLFRVIYSFHMPLFFCIAGATSAMAELKYPTQKPFKFISSKFKQLIIPFFSWAAVSFVLMEKVSPSALGIRLPELIRSVDVGLWFLVALFLCHTVVKIGEQISKFLKFAESTNENNIFLRSSFFAYLISLAFCAVSKIIFDTYNFFGSGFLLKYLPFFLLGRFWQIKGRWTPNGQAVIALLLILYLALLPLYHRTGKQTELLAALNIPPQTLMTVAVYYLVGIFGSIIFLKLVATIDQYGGGMVRGSLIFCGSRSLDIYAIQVYFFSFFTTFTGVVLSLIGIAVVSVSIRKSELATKILLGGK